MVTITKQDTTRKIHTKSGILPSVMPGQRMAMIVVARFAPVDKLAKPPARSPRSQ
jgi:hypothetical protein